MDAWDLIFHKDYIRYSEIIISKNKIDAFYNILDQCQEHHRKFAMRELLDNDQSQPLKLSEVIRYSYF
mgnify:CR=1 FL=1